jgi:hypothetical protein
MRFRALPATNLPFSDTSCFISLHASCVACITGVVPCEMCGAAPVYAAQLGLPRYRPCPRMSCTNKSKRNADLSTIIREDHQRTFAMASLMSSNTILRLNLGFATRFALTAILAQSAAILGCTRGLVSHCIMQEGLSSMAPAR